MAAPVSHPRFSGASLNNRILDRSRRPLPPPPPEQGPPPTAKDAWNRLKRLQTGHGKAKF